MNFVKLILVFLSAAFFSHYSLADLNNNNQKGFNELLITSHLKFIGQWNTQYGAICNVAPECPANTALMYANKSAELVYNFEINGKTSTFRDVLSLKVIEPTKGSYPLETEIIYALKKIYQERNMTLILAFGKPFPNWWQSAVDTLRAQNPQMSQQVAEAEVTADIIARFIQRIRYWYPSDINATWVQNKLRIEPLNEINAINGSPVFHAQLDARVKNKLQSFNVTVKDVVSSSIISGTNWQYLDWFWNYYSNGGVGTPNVHLYFEPRIESSYSAAVSRFESVVSTLRTHAHSTLKEVIIGEIGFPAKGIPEAASWSESTHDNLMSTISNSKTLSEGSPILFWQLFKNYLPFPTLSQNCRNYPCADQQAMDTTFGFVDARQASIDSQLSTYFLPYGFWWSP